MSCSSNRSEHVFKACARKGCNNEGTWHLRILYINKEGLFCSTCKEEIERDGIVVTKDES